MKWTNETNIDNLSDTASVFLAKMKRLVQGRKITNIRGIYIYIYIINTA